MLGLSALGIGFATFLIFLIMMFLLVIGMPLGFLTGLVALFFTFGWFGPGAVGMIGTRVFSFVTEYSLVAIPMFVLMASMLDKTGVARDLYNAMRLVAGRLKGGVGVQTIVVAALLAAMSGIIGGETVLLGMLALPQMLRLGYNKNLAIGTVVAGGSLGTMIPPSIVLIMYGMTANVSIGDLFTAAIIPGLILVFMYISYVLIRCYLNPAMGPPAPQAELAMTTRDKLRSLGHILLPLTIVGWVLGSIYGGIASVTEAACMGVIGVFLSALIRKELTRDIVHSALRVTMRTCGMIIWIGIGASALVGIYNLMGGKRFVENAILSLDVAPIIIILLMMAILLALGMFLDWIGIVMLTMPIFVPIITSLGYDPIWFGVVFCINMQVSFLSPPFGPAAFYLKSVAPPDISLVDIYKSVWPFIIMQIVALGLVLSFPEIALWLTQ
ncbi:MAG: TRAP transporter large permease subunit [Deltaproteobacteria bacterium]|nr:TRAP transporter large permease subunit [Deltaproteobacteria bacterium]